MNFQPDWKSGLSICEYLGVLFISFVLVSFSYDFSLFDLKINFGLKQEKRNKKRNNNNNDKKGGKRKLDENNNSSLKLNNDASYGPAETKSGNNDYQTAASAPEVKDEGKARLLGNVQEGEEEDEKMQIFNN